MIEQKDPNGKDAHNGGAKLDLGKNRVSLLFMQYFPNAIDAVTSISEFGAKKYSPGGWRDVPDGMQRYTDALARHYLADCKGEIFDPETKLPHDFQLAWNALARIEFGMKEGKYGMKLSKSDSEVFFDALNNLTPPIQKVDFDVLGPIPSIKDKEKSESFDKIMSKYDNKKAIIRHEKMMKPYHAHDLESRKRDALNLPTENPDFGKVVTQVVSAYAEHVKAENSKKSTCR